MIIKPVLKADDSECKYSDENSVYQLISEGFRGVAALLRRLLFNKLTFLTKTYCIFERCTDYSS